VVVFCNFKKFVLDILFPIKCLGCNMEGKWICDSCQTDLKNNHFLCCPLCGIGNNDGSVCGYCQANSCLDGLFVVLEDNKLSRKLICHIKYNFITDLLLDLEKNIHKFLDENPLWQDSFALVPVPLHKKKLLKRGFSQASLIAETIGRVGGNKLNQLVIKRTKYTRPQVGLTANERRKNILDNFSIGDCSGIDYNNPIVLVDDVYTTGSTLQECARTLKNAGYKRVMGLVLIRG